MSGRIRSTKLFGCALAVSIGFFPCTGSGQDESGGEIEEIVVTGIRQSQAEALGIKRDNVNFVDAISAEDVGKLPDGNIAEALQRVPGVAIQRERGEGDFVSIRGLGPDFVRGTINGRTYTSGTESFDSTLNGAAAKTTGRATNFDVLPSEIIDVLEVYKSASAEQVEGGIGGVVNVRTARPMDLGNARGGSLRAQYGDFSEETNPSGSAFVSWNNDANDFGILTAVSFSERGIREDLANTWGYLPPNDLTGWTINLDTDGDGVGDRGDFFFPSALNAEIFTEQRERATVNSTLQWVLGDDTEAVADILWSRRDVTSEQFGQIIYFAPWTGANSICKGGNADGSWDCSGLAGLEFQNHTLVSAPISVGFDNFTDSRGGGDESLNLGFNLSRQVGVWDIAADASYADASGSLTWERTVLSYADGVNPPAAPGANPTVTARGIQGTGSTLDNAIHFVPDAEDPQLTNPAYYALQQNEVTVRDNTDSEWALKLDLVHEREGSAIAALKFGGYLSRREKSFDTSRARSAAGEGRDNPVIATSVSGSTMRAPDNFLNGDAAWLTPSDMLFPNNPAVFATRGANLVYERIAVETFVAAEDVQALYFQMDIDSSLAGMPLSGNAGVRLVSTALNIVGQSQKVRLREAGVIRVPEFFGSVEDFPFEDDYTNALPSVNLRLDISDELLARFSYSKTLTRPEFTFLAPTFAITNATNYLASNGNPGLLPYLADNIDASLEWYFDQASALTAAVFVKQVDDFITDSIGRNVDIAGVTWAEVKRPENQGKAEISGLEVGYTHALSNLPAPFDGLGLILNVTSVDSELRLKSGGEVPFPGVSDMSLNSAVYYDRGPVQARLAYAWRDAFLFDPAGIWGNELYVDEYGQWDFSASYENLRRCHRLHRRDQPDRRTGTAAFGMGRLARGRVASIVARTGGAPYRVRRSSGILNRIDAS